jgi:hypothetical protein
MCVVSALFFPASPTMLGVAFALLAVGCLLHLLVKGQLIRNVALCTEGAYALVRHPYYLANYLVDSSFCLLSGNVYLLLLYPFLFFWAYGPTLRLEEAFLAAVHGDAFEAHRGTVPQVFPEASSFTRLGQLLRHFSWRRVSAGEIKRLLRFPFIGTLIALVQHLGLEGLQQIAAGQNPLHRSSAVLLALCVLFLLASVLTPRRRDRTDQ